MRFDNNTRSRVVERLDIVNVQVQENDNEETESVLVNVSKTIAMSYCTELQLRVSQTSTSFPGFSPTRPNEVAIYPCYFINSFFHY